MSYKQNPIYFGNSNQRPLQQGTHQHGQLPNTQMFRPTNTNNINQSDPFLQQQHQMHSRMPVYGNIAYGGSNVPRMPQQQGGWPRSQQQQHQQMLYAQHHQQQQPRLHHHPTPGQQQPRPQYHPTPSQQNYPSHPRAQMPYPSTPGAQQGSMSGRQRVDSDAVERKRKQDIANSFKAATSKSGKRLVEDLLSKTDLELGSYVAHAKTDRQTTSVFAPKRTFVDIPVTTEPITTQESFGMMQIATTQPVVHPMTQPHQMGQLESHTMSQPYVMAQPIVHPMDQVEHPVPSLEASDDFGDFQSGQQVELSAFSGSTDTHLPSTSLAEPVSDTRSTVGLPISISTVPHQSGMGPMSFADLIPKDTIKGTSFQSNRFVDNPLTHTSQASDDEKMTELPSNLQQLGELNNVEETNKGEEISKEDEVVALYGSQLPSWCYDPSFLPSIYKKICEKCLSNTGLLSTNEVRSILLKSSVPKETLANIWEQCNRRTPGMLVPEELFAILALIALAQAGWTKLTISKLASCTAAPIPEFPEYLFMAKGESVFDGVDGVNDSQHTTNDVDSLSPVDPNDKYSVFKAFLAKQDQNLEINPLQPQTTSSITPDSNTTQTLSKPSNTLANFSLSNISNTSPVTTSNVFTSSSVASFANSQASFASVPHSTITTYPELTSFHKIESTRHDSFNQFVSSQSENDDFGDFQDSQPTPPNAPVPFNPVDGEFHNPNPNHDPIPSSAFDFPFQSSNTATSCMLQQQSSTEVQNDFADFGTFESAFDAPTKDSTQSSTSVTKGAPNFEPKIPVMNTTNANAPVPTFETPTSNIGMLSDLNWQPFPDSNDSKPIPQSLITSDAFSSLTFANTQPSNLPIKSERKIEVDMQIGSISSWLQPHESNTTTTLSSTKSSVQNQLPTFTSAPMPTTVSSEASFAPRLNDADRYKALTGDVQDGERHVVEWTRCIRIAYNVFKTASLAIHNTTLSKEVKREIIETAKGKSYFDALKQIYCVVARLKTAIKYSALANSNAQLVDLFRRIEETWTDIQHSFDGIYPLPQSLDMNACYTSDVDAKVACGVCLLSTKRVIDEFSALDLSFAHLSYSGKIYHSTCANFWCNKVNSVLPGLPVLSSGLL